METRNLFFKGDKLEMLLEGKSGSTSVTTRVVSTEPISLEILQSISENLLNKLNSTSEAIVADSKRGYAYKAKIVSVNNGMATVSLLGRHEARNHFRADTVIMLGYEVLREAVPSQKGEEDLKGTNIGQILDKLNNVGEFERSMATLIAGMYGELRELRKEMSKTSECETETLIQRVVNISGSGIQFSTSREHNKGDRLRIYVQLPGHNQPIVANAKVIRVDSEFGGAGGASTTISCTFEELEENDREALIRFVFQAQRQKLRRRATGSDS